MTRLLPISIIMVIAASVKKIVGGGNGALLPMPQMLASAFSLPIHSAITRSDSHCVNSSRNILRRNIMPTQMIQKNRSCSPPSQHARGIFLSAMDGEGESEKPAVDDVTFDSDHTWNLGGLRKEVSRLTVRCHKKIGKANQRLKIAEEKIDRLTGPSGEVSSEELKLCPNLNELEKQLDELRNRLTSLNRLEVLLQDIKGKKAVLPDHIAALAIQLNVKDEQNPRERGPKKQKGPKNMNSFRLPYRRYYTSDKTEVRVRGKIVADYASLFFSL